MVKAAEEPTGRINLRVSERQERVLGAVELLGPHHLRRCVRGGREFGARAVVVDALDEDAVAFYGHFGFHALEGPRLWRRLGDVAHALGTEP